ncbi:hypothetical protein HMPREF0766_12296 [Sphingobacterium spiritivorum ATCC 33861]|uniref:Uncharacterized protein n=1 Tax=Sphingobacterium spiritivorum ATCC 33861 TaxID=525373 RepID=D7VMS6_SPHSI|nr:hypothetical protein HMPREF0766_12296 [Sphingobacterium spiritivorum ATCC 33861]
MLFRSASAKIRLIFDFCKFYLKIIIKRLKEHFKRFRDNYRPCLFELQR